MRYGLSWLAYLYIKLPNAQDRNRRTCDDEALIWPSMAAKMQHIAAL